MANCLALLSVAQSIATFLNTTYPAEIGGVAAPGCTFTVISSGELEATPDDTTRVSLYLYRITINEHLRQHRPERMSPQQQAPLGLDLHFMLTSWAGNAHGELVPMAWAMRQLHQHPILDASSLTPDAGWGPDEVVQIIPAELSPEDMARIWDSIQPGYRLSVSYIARMVRLDPDTFLDASPVVATRFTAGRAVPAGVSP